MEQVYWNPTMETMPREQLRALQNERLRDVVRRVYEHVPFYRNKMQQLGITPNDIHGVEDLHLLPFTEKQDLRNNYPFGLFAVPRDHIVRLHASSGTTGSASASGQMDRLNPIGSGAPSASQMLRVCSTSIASSLVIPSGAVKVAQRYTPVV